MAAVDFTAVRASLLALPEGPSDKYDVLQAADITVDWLSRTGLRRPAVVRSVAAGAQVLGMKLPPPTATSLQSFAEQLGYGTQVCPKAAGLGPPGISNQLG